MKTKNKRNYLKQNGITLIALVVTIVVLLILAGVSLNAIFSENGIIKRAKDAQNKMDQATQNDLDSINELNNWIDGKINGTTGSGGTVEGKEGSLLAMYQKAQKDGCDNAGGTCSDATHLHIGDYVDYKNPTSGTAEVTSAESYVYGPTAMNKIGAMYLNSTYATKARSATMDDVNEVTGVTTPEEIKKVAGEYGTSFRFENQYTPKLWLEIGKKADTTKAITVDGDGEGTKGVTGYEYYVNSTNAEITSAKMTNTRAYDLLFKGVDTKPYWLASRGVIEFSGVAGFSPAVVAIDLGDVVVGVIDGFFTSTGDEFDVGFAVRPVVILKSDVMATDVAKIADPT